MCGRGGGRYKISRCWHFVVAASAATKFGDVRFPRAERGAKFVKRAFARDRQRAMTAVAQLAKAQTGVSVPHKLNLVVSGVRAVVIRFRLFHAVGDQRDVAMPIWMTRLKSLRESEADQETDHRAAGDELRRVFRGDRFEVELLAQRRSSSSMRSPTRSRALSMV